MGIHERKEGFRNGVVTQPMSSQLTPSEHMELDGEGAEGGGSCAQQRGPAPRPSLPADRGAAPRWDGRQTWGSPASGPPLGLSVT